MTEAMRGRQTAFVGIVSQSFLALHINGSRVRAPRTRPQGALHARTEVDL
jgi:hypothetical protein